jgi:hypothetical protein
MLRLFCLCWLVCFSPFSTAAHAAQCASYLDQKTGYRLLFQTDGTVQEHNKDGIVQSAHRYYRAGQSVWLRDIESGYGRRFHSAGSGKQLKQADGKWGDTVYARQQPDTCPSDASLAYLSKPECSGRQEKACCAAGDIGACIAEARIGGSTQELQQYCRTEPQACLALMAQYDEAANKHENPFGGMYAQKKPLPAAQLDEVADMCGRFKTPDLCRKALQQLWRAQRFSQAAGLFGELCKAHLDEHACARQKQLSSFQFPKVMAPATSVPCGEYRSTVSALTGTLDFKDKGVATIAIGSDLRARLEGGLVKMRHDKGGDFVFARLGEDVLLGLDDWNSFEVYRREAAPAKACQPPVVFKEKPLSDGCGLDKDPAACCKAGDSQGCNRLGSMAALKNNWQEAATQYAKVCAQGVRVGCENWIYTVGKTGDEMVEEGLKGLCAKDDHHVACDLLETGNLQKMFMAYELEKMLKDDKATAPRPKRPQ